MKSIANRLTAAGYVPGEDSQVCALLSGLPEEYNTIVTVLETQKETLTVSGVTVQLLLYESKLKDQDNSENQNEESETAFNAKESRKCFYCKKKGHLKRDCRKYLKAKNFDRFKRNDSHDIERTQVAFVASQCEVQVQEHFIIDSGASSHMVRHRSWFANLKTTNIPEYVQLGDGRKIKTEGVGSVPLRVSTGKSLRRIVLKDVLYVPSLKTSLISLSKATKNGINAKFFKDECHLLRTDGTLIAKAVKRRNLYNLIGKVETDTLRSESMMKAKEEDSDLWHFRYAHLNHDDVKKLGAGMASGISIGTNTSREDRKLLCVPCQVGKGHRMPINRERNSTAMSIMELVHSDLCGPVSPPSLGGSRYVLTLTDDYSRASWILFLKSKAEVSDQVQSWITLVENQFGVRVKRIRTDRGGEYINSILNKYFRSKGINHQKTVAYTPQQNGVAERLNRTLFDKARCILAHLPDGNKRLWAEAVATANHV